MITIHHFPAGAAIIQENDPGETAYIIERGRVAVTKEKSGQKVLLGYRISGEIFGEMSLIDDKPRSATVTAVEETVVKEIHRDRFLEILHGEPEVAVTLLRALFNRLREASSLIVELQTLAESPSVASLDQPSIQVTLKALTNQAATALPTNPYVINRFPCRIGRRTNDPLAYNDLELSDEEPYQISRHHLVLLCEGDRVAAQDRGSYLGSEIDGWRTGGHGRSTGRIFFQDDEGLLLLGPPASPYRYQVIISRQPAVSGS